MTPVIDFRVRLPLELRPEEELPADYLEQYDKVLDLSANRHRTLPDLFADMAASGTERLSMLACHTNPTRGRVRGGRREPHSSTRAGSHFR